MDPANVPAKFEVRSFLPVPEIIGGTQKIHNIHLTHSRRRLAIESHANYVIILRYKSFI